MTKLIRVYGIKTYDRKVSKIIIGKTSLSMPMNPDELARGLDIIFDALDIKDIEIQIGQMK